MMIQRIGVLALAMAALVAAQDKVTVPLSDPSQPATLKINQVTGSITITAGKAGEVVVESGSRATSRKEKEPVAAAGMHRIDAGRGGMDVTEEHNVVTVQTGRFGLGGNTVIQAPANTSLQVKTVNGGHIEVTGMSGEIDADIVNGAILLKNVSGAVVAHSVNGSVTVTVEKIAADKPMSFTTLNGKIDVTLPADTKARLRLKSDRGAIYSDFDVKLEQDASKPTVEEGRGTEGKYRIRIDKSVYGAINGGGPEYRFESMNGNIVIRKK